MTTSQRFSAATVAAKITGVDRKEILANWRKGANPQGKMKYAVITANQIANGTYRKAKAVETVEA